jgi:hypothetical protein
MATATAIVMAIATAAEEAAAADTGFRYAPDARNTPFTATRAASLVSRLSPLS